MKKRIISILTIVSTLILIYELIDSFYYKSYNGNQEIVFIDFKGTELKNYSELSELPQLKGKWIFATLNLRDDRDEYKPDLEIMDSLYFGLKESNIVFVYTVENVDQYDWKKTIRKYELKGFHIDLPDDYEYNLWEDSVAGYTTHWKIPKYMIISDKGEIIDKWSPRPRDYTKLIDRFNELKNRNNERTTKNIGHWVDSVNFEDGNN